MFVVLSWLLIYILPFMTVTHFYWCFPRSIFSPVPFISWNMSKSRENALSYSPHKQTKENKICRDFSIYKYHILKVGNVMWIFNKTMAVRRTFESVLSFYDEDYYYCCFKAAAAAAAARMYAIFTISWLLSWISYCVQPKSRQWEFF